jgi:hypothetical protein
MLPFWNWETLGANVSCSKKQTTSSFRILAGLPQPLALLGRNVAVFNAVYYRSFQVACAFQLSYIPYIQRPMLHRQSKGWYDHPPVKYETTHGTCRLGATDAKAAKNAFTRYKRVLPPFGRRLILISGSEQRRCAAKAAKARRTRKQLTRIWATRAAYCERMRLRRIKIRGF